MRKAAILVLSLLPCLLGADKLTKIADSAVLPYKATATTEVIETTIMDRLLLDGKYPILMNPLPSMVSRPAPPGYSLLMGSPYNSLIQVGFRVFPDKVFTEDFNAEVMLDYLKELQAQSKKEDNFEVLVEPFENFGIANFRFLNSRPYVLSYAYTHYDEQQRSIRMIRQEAWSQIGDYYYVVIVQAPERAFPQFLQAVSIPIATMTFIDS